ncbi:sodium/hydrogen exchanger 9B1-like [Athalia rosae]|uniref:sodium/hydrogen exchanger 9B1-like n=1 Tax=Athalia rosae TaxID=37344 RepID=UPI00203453E4|nr:sodium/hydrogen exchanger 9B1-like [Athalia rosae]
MESEGRITSDDVEETTIELNDVDASENPDADRRPTDSEGRAIASVFLPEAEATRCDWVIRRLRNISATTAILGARHPNFTWLTIFHWATNLASALLSWALLYFLFGDPAAPGGAIFTLLLLVAAAYCLGWGLTHVPYLHLPPVFGMLVAGVIARNSGLYNIRDTMSPRAMGAVRNFCLTFVMVRSGIQLNTTPLRSHPVFLLILALLPCTLEMFVVTFCFKGLLDFPWDWAFLGGCVIACMSPVVTVNCLLALADQGYGEDQDIAGLLCAACSIDGVHIVAVFSIAFSVVFDGSSEAT